MRSSCCHVYSHQRTAILLPQHCCATHISLTFLAAALLSARPVVSLPVVAVCFYGIRLQGHFVLFWLVYYITLCVGIGELQQTVQAACTSPVTAAAHMHIPLDQGTRCRAQGTAATHYFEEPCLALSCVCCAVI
jgi:hypothetical protein